MPKEMSLITAPVTAHVTVAQNRGKNLTIVYGVHDFPIGKMMVAMTHEGVCWVGFGDKMKKLKAFFPKANFIHDPSVTEKPAKAMAKAWPNKMGSLTVPMVLYGTKFQIGVWKSLLKIKTGDVTTYGDIAKKLKKPKAVRAVGTAVGSNPISIFVPCHRVVNKDTNRINYGGGVEMKKTLLRKEGTGLY